MTDEQIARRIAQSVSEINRILAQLEIDTGRQVEDVCLKRYDVTSIMDAERRQLVTVGVELRRIFGQDWA
jgi:hypothetical protein